MSWKRWIAAGTLLMQLPLTLMAKPAGLPLDQRINYAASETPVSVPIAPADQPSSPAARRAVEIFQRASNLLGHVKECAGIKTTWAIQLHKGMSREVRGRITEECGSWRYLGWRSLHALLAISLS